MFRHLLFPSDFSPGSERVLAQARELALRTGARVTLLHVNQSLIPVLADAYAIAYPASMGEFSRELDAQLRARLEDQGQTLRGAGIDTAIELTQGHAGTEIVAYARQQGCSLIMMGSRGLGPIRSALLGGTSTFVLQHSPCPVLILPDDPA